MKKTQATIPHALCYFQYQLCLWHLHCSWYHKYITTLYLWFNVSHNTSCTCSKIHLWHSAQLLTFYTYWCNTKFWRINIDSPKYFSQHDKAFTKTLSAKFLRLIKLPKFCLTKNCWFDEGPKGLKLNRDYMSEMSKCNTGPTAFAPPSPVFHLFFSIEVSLLGVHTHSKSQAG